MARKIDLLGMGVGPILARRQATDPQTAIAVGSSSGSAFQLGGDQYFVTFTSTSAGQGSVTLPAIGGDNGALLGDDFLINNQTGATMEVFGPTGTTISISGAVQSLSTGISLTNHVSLTLYPITSSSWMGIRSA